MGRFWFAASAAVEAPGQLDSCSLRATLHINPCNTPDLPWAREVLLPQNCPHLQLPDQKVLVSCWFSQPLASLPFLLSIMP